MTTTLAPPTSRLDLLPPGLPERTLGYEVAQWCMTYLEQPNGLRAGEAWRPTKPQMRFLAWWFAVDEDGRWLFQHAARRQSKGTGKSPFTAVLALAELAGPVVVDDFDDRVPGGVVGKTQPMPLVALAGVSKDGARGPMRQVEAFAQKGSRVVKIHALDPGKTIFYREPVGELRLITSSAASVEGAELSAAFADETQLWVPQKNGDELMSTLQDNLAKSGSRLVETSNAWVPGDQSVAEDTFEAWVAQEEGRVRPGAGRILYDARIAPPDTDMSDDESLTKALEFVYEGCFWIDIDVIKGRIWTPSARPDDSIRKYLNRPAVSQRAWVDPDLWETMARPAIEVEEGERVCLFFDGSKTRDATALVGCRMSDGHIFTLGVWEPDWEKDETIDVDDVDRVVRLAFERYDVAAFFADVREWESWVLSEWPQRYGDDLDLKSAPNAKPAQSIAWDMRSHKKEFAIACEAAHGEITEGLFTHDGNSALARHVANTRNRPYQSFMSVGKDSANSPKKIDAAVCMIGARMLYRQVGDKAPKKSRRMW